ncbi:BolA family transcriptional regulator [Fluoribacter dumoffii]|uniref:Transcriptional regulator BolA n=1 Tax=Fluoribacter dumoffii TaxID=463 RepID=A0A377GAX1_9GAMM|nr:BolA family transcriptional regulator [Fluoribacter dumoffii]KTC88753.1 regulator of penicillin binding proteins and beta lactamase transcription (morphogene) [Fluoribacter dumoffii NY 23]MCW8385952.1 BolA family transcriptional regulator [Fluoribacter dumoffii]MCW8419005.1 BolA family transcriptional regulator [Fluoribacter dumoffii]MCW8453151.1 BolA family transcriptional regulator [Fluoribacter dumoffii]MCW8459631.1 BolA family transcriptional regulator [Fluoribacter dumoffii]
MSRKNRIEELLNHELAPVFLNVEDESGQHHVPENAQTHFKITVVSSQFSALSRLARHRLLNHLLKKEFERGLHALSMHLFTPEEWESRNKNVLNSPSCKGGFNRENQNS